MSSKRLHIWMNRVIVSWSYGKGQEGIRLQAGYQDTFWLPMWLTETYPTNLLFDDIDRIGEILLSWFISFRVKCRNTNLKWSCHPSMDNERDERERESTCMSAIYRCLLLSSRGERWLSYMLESLLEGIALIQKYDEWNMHQTCMKERE